MKKKHIQYIIGLMIFALSGLIYLQFQWVADSIAVKEAHFDQTVQEALEKIAQTIQQVELLQSAQNQRGEGQVNYQQTTYTTQYRQITPQNGKIAPQTRQTPFLPYPKRGVASNTMPLPKTQRAFLGIYYNLDSIHKGIYLDDVIVGSGADKAGLCPGDLIVRLNGKKANKNWILSQTIKETGIGNALDIAFLRKDSLYYTKAMLGLPFTKKRLPYLGIYTTYVYTFKKDKPRIQILHIDKGSLGERIGLQQYDIINQLNHQSLWSEQTVITELDRLDWKSPLQIQLYRKKKIEEICYSLALETAHLTSPPPISNDSPSIGIYGTDRIWNGDTLMGLTITKIVRNSEAHKVGLQKNDVIIRFNDYVVHNFNDFRRGLIDWQDHRKGYIRVLRQRATQNWDTLQLYFHRWHPETISNSWKELRAKYQMPKYVDRLLNDKNKANRALLGIEFTEDKDSTDSKFGVLVDKVIDDSPAQRAGLLKGDIVVAIDNKPVQNSDALVNILKNYKPNQEITINYKRPAPIKRHTNYETKNTDSIRSPTQLEPLIVDEKVETFVVPEAIDMPSHWGPLAYAQLIDQATLTEQIVATLKQDAEAIFYEMALMDKPIKERISESQLMAILTGAFKDAGINIPFEYGLLSSSQQIIYSSQPAVPAEVLARYPYHKKILDYSILSYPGELRIRFPKQNHFLWNRSLVHLFASLLFNILIVGTFAYTIYTIIRQKKFSDMKTDFINNMTHELKTPISTIKLACEILKDPNLPKTKQRIARYAGIIDDENERLQNHVEKVLHFARLEKGNLKLNKEKLDVHELMNEAIQKISLRIQKREGSISCYLDALQPIVVGDKMHLTNVIYNLLDNAIKYSQEAPEITVYTRNTKEGLLVAIQDKGIGMSKEAVKHIFDKFYRVSTGNRHDVKGFGLGLSYVKLMIEAHNGFVNAKSKLKKGSTVTFTLPIAPSLAHKGAKGKS